jgi:streptothricin acetyltransferase
MPGMMLETQTNNVGACKLYESCGFQIGGIDSFLYKGLGRDPHEVAIFWYLLFDEEERH